MTYIEGGVEPNRKPTDAEISAEVVYLDTFGIKVSELTSDNPVDPNRYIGKQPELLNPIIDHMADRGWAFAGSGYFAAVFVKGGLALKIGLKASDTGAMYAAWCRANQGLPGVPTIYGITKFTRCYLVLMRRCDELREEWLDEDDEHYLAELAEEYTCVKAAVNRGNAPGIDKFDTVATALAIHDFFTGVVDFDLHSANIMLGMDGELVITDPISYGPCSNYSYYYSDVPAYSSIS